MLGFFNSYYKYVMSFNQINDAALKYPKEFVEQVEFSYKNTISEIAREIKSLKSGCKVVMISGPSSSGKTTTSNMIINELKKIGFGSTIISLDDFFRGTDGTPILSNGDYDYENINALNIPQLQECLLSLIKHGYCEKPIFDFVNSRPSDYKQEVKLQKNEIAIVEGIHALNPLILKQVPNDNILKIYISVKQGISTDDELLLSPREVRFLRRLVRDFRFRGSSPAQTAYMWKGVCEGEEKNIFPYRKTSNITINSIHLYEPCVICKDALSLLETFDKDSEHYPFVCKLKNTLSKFNQIDEAIVPKDSLMREFIGGGIY